MADPASVQDRPEAIDRAFLLQFGREVLDAFENDPSDLQRALKRISTNSTLAVFQKPPKGTASTKSTHGMVSVLNLDHSSFPIYFEETAIRQPIDNVNELKKDVLKRLSYANSCGNSFTIKADEVIVKELLHNADTLIQHCNDGLSPAKLDYAIDEIPKICFVGWVQWAQLHQYSAFKYCDYLKGYNHAKLYHNCLVVPTVHLPFYDGIRTCFIFERDSVATGYSDKIKTSLRTIQGETNIVLEMDLGCGTSSEITAIECIENL
jgi:hypothetical protein